MVAVPISTTVSSDKVRLYCDILMGALTNSTSQTLFFRILFTPIRPDYTQELEYYLYQ